MEREWRAGRRWRGAMALLVAGALLVGGCNRSPFVLTECVDGRPVVERTLDVAPPNC